MPPLPRCHKLTDTYKFIYTRLADLLSRVKTELLYKRSHKSGKELKGFLISLD